MSVELFENLIILFDLLHLFIELLYFFLWSFSLDKLGLIPVSLLSLVAWNFASFAPWASKRELTFVSLAIWNNFYSIPVWSTTNPFTLICCSVLIFELSFHKFALIPFSYESLTALVFSFSMAVKMAHLKLAFNNIILFSCDLAFTVHDSCLPHTSVYKPKILIVALAVSMRFPNVPCTLIYDFLFDCYLSKSIYKTLFELTLENSFETLRFELCHQS